MTGKNVIRTDAEIEKMIPLFAAAEGDVVWPEGVAASELLLDYLNGSRSREYRHVRLDLQNYCHRAWRLVAYADVNPEFGMFVACAITIVWMLGNDPLLVKVVNIEPDIEGIIEKLFLIMDTYDIDFDRAPNFDGSGDKE